MDYCQFLRKMLVSGSQICFLTILPDWLGSKREGEKRAHKTDVYNITLERGNHHLIWDYFQTNILQNYFHQNLQERFDFCLLVLPWKRNFQASKDAKKFNYNSFLSPTLAIPTRIKSVVTYGSVDWNPLLQGSNLFFSSKAVRWMRSLWSFCVSYMTKVWQFSRPHLAHYILNST